MITKRDKVKSINTSVGIVDYVVLTNDIVDGYFDLTTGQYQPHLGIANCMLVFYNQFYKNKDEEEIVSVNVFEPIVKDKSFINSFNKSLFTTEEFAYDFAHAYKDAMDIVDVKKYSLSEAISGITNGISDVLNNITSVMSQENIEKVLELSNRLANNDITAEKILESYKDSKYYKKV